MKKSLLVLLTLLIVLATGCSTKQNEENRVLTETEKDGYILFSYSLEDAERNLSSHSDTIEVSNSDNRVTYNFSDHVLICGTHMTGSITKNTESDMTSYTGSFTVTNNSYQIDRLEIDYSTDMDTQEKNGSLIVNDSTIDINAFF